MRVLLTHNRPLENDCYDGFAEWLRQHCDVLWRHWRDPLPGHDVSVCCMQDPVGKTKLKALPPGTLNTHQTGRETYYPTWRQHGIRCPDGPWPFSYDVAERRLPVLLKDLTRQMGRGYACRTAERLWDVTYTAAKFDAERYSILPLVDVRDEDGLATLHRYLVCGDRAYPVVLAKTTGWSAKASHMKRDLVSGRVDRDKFERQLEEFWDSVPHPSVAQSVAVAGLDFALVDCTVMDDGVPMMWEVNPYMNLRPAEAVGKREVWWPAFASYILQRDVPMGPRPTARAWTQNILDWQGYKMHWRSRGKGDSSRERDDSGDGGD